ncbi:hypothetical protein [Glaciecola petra]|uniref:Uncharacterized protein n=1 Tax=Glaciecola petra TaxID=3075602 RepID=A0ABU2ZUH3_9ALTE|nr:hypothetical protein [Aestuariibacter sp. P117]MDT0596293.1 hypothetical protein [Aestuariibacter sp. P117]
MSLIIKDKISLANYFSFMLVSTIMMLGIVVASMSMPMNKAIISVVFTILSLIALGSSYRIMSLTLPKIDN